MKMKRSSKKDSSCFSINSVSLVFLLLFCVVVMFFMLYQYVWRSPPTFTTSTPTPTPEPTTPFSEILNNFAQTITRKDLQQNSELFHSGGSIDFFRLMSWLTPSGFLTVPQWINQMDVMQAEFITNHMTLTNQYNITSDSTDVIGYYTYTLDTIGNTTNLPTVICSFVARFVFLSNLISTTEVLENATCTFLWYSSAGVDGTSVIPMAKRAIPDVERWNISLTQIDSLLSVNQRNVALSICNTTQFLTLKSMFDPLGTDPANQCNSQSLNTELTIPLTCSGNGEVSKTCLPDSYDYLQVTTLNVTNITCTTTVIEDTCLPSYIASINTIPPFLPSRVFTITGGPGVGITGLVNGISIRNLGVLGVVFTGTAPILNATFINQILFLNPNPQPANTVYAGPTSGSPAQPAFRSIINDDITSLSVSKIYGVLPVVNGGTGSGTPLVGGKFMISSFNNTIIEGEDIFAINGTGVIQAGDGITIVLVNGSFVISADPRITSVSLTAPADIFMVTSGTITNGPAVLSFDIMQQFQNTFWAGPTNTTMGYPSFREIVINDLPNNIPFSKFTGILPIEQGGTNSGSPLINNTIMVSFNGQIVEASLINGTGITTTVNNGIITINNDGLLVMSLDVPLDILAVSGSPTLGSTGSFVITKQIQLQNTFWAGPVNGTSGSPLFRVIEVDDLPSNIPVSKLVGILPIDKGGTNSGTSLSNNKIMLSYAGQIVESSLINGTGITTTVNDGIITINNDGLLSVSLTVPSDILAVSGSPTSGNVGSFVVTKQLQTEKTFFAGPVTGTPEEPVFRAIEETDLPTLLDGQLYIGSGGTPIPAYLQAGTNVNISFAAGTIIISAGTGLNFTSGTGTVTSVGLSLPTSIFDLTTSLVTNSGVLTAILLVQDRNLIWAGPPSGIGAVPSFRSLVEADLPILGLGQIFLGTGTSTEAKNVTAGTGIAISLDGNGNLVITSTAIGTVTSITITVPTSFLSVSPSTITSSGTFGITLISQLQNTFFASPDGSSGNPTFRSIVLRDLPELLNGQLYIGSTGSSVVASTLTAGPGVNITNSAGIITISGTALVSSVGLSLPVSVFSVTVSTVTSSGVLTAIFQTQSANTFFAGPTSGGSATPTFRVIVTTDLPALANGEIYIGNTGVPTVGTISAGTGISVTPGPGTLLIDNTGVTSVSLSLPISLFSVSGSPVTTTGTLTATFVVQTTKTFFAGPISGAATTPTFRVIATTDLPALGNGEMYIGNFGVPTVGTIAAGAGISVTPGPGSLTISATATGTVTSVGLSLPVSIFSVSGTPITTSGTLTAVFQTQSANTIFAGPTSGGAATPTFRSQVTADLPHITNGQLYIGSTGSSVVAASLTAGTGISVTNGAGTITVANTGVTSVALSLPVSIFSVSGTPVTTTGTLTGTLATQTANTIFAGATSGGAATPAFRALVAADIPAVTTLTYTEVSSTTTISAFSTASFTVATTMTTTPAAGTYQVTFSASMTQSNSAGNYEYAIFNGASQLTHSTRTATGSTTTFAITTQGVVVATGSSAVSLQWRKTAGAGSADMFQRSMFLLRIS
jgi:hypothetical protein